MNTQEIFNTVATHLLTQNARSMGTAPQMEGRGCLYRGENGRMCAVGCLIKDEFYDPILENEPVRDPDVIFAVDRMTSPVM